MDAEQLRYLGGTQQLHIRKHDAIFAQQNDALTAAERTIIV
jgi:hypothetical protein